MKEFSLFLVSIVIIFIVLIFLIKGFRLKNENIAILFVLLCLVFNVVYWKVNKSPCDNCIIGKTKRYSGLLFGGCFEIFHVLHFLFWLIIGLLAPNHYTFVIIASVLWEMTEHVYFKTSGLCPDIFCGRVEDIITNVAAYALGSYLSFK
jgi:hypothetical protein